MRPNMNTMNTRSIIAALSAVVVLASLIGCGDPTKPKDVKYNLYVGATHLATSPEDSSFNRIYIYDADSLTLLDSISRPYLVTGLTVSPDGRSVYVYDFASQWAPSAITRIDARTRQVVWSRSGLGGYLHFVADGRLLLAGNNVLQPEDGTLLRRISDSLFVRWGPVSGTKVAAIVRNSLTDVGNDSAVRVVDVATGALSGRYVGRLSSGVALQEIYTARLHPDGRRVLAIGVYGSDYNSWFVVGDVETGQTLFQYQISYPHGEIAISSDGNMAVFTDPGASSFEWDGIPYVIDLRTYRVVAPSSHTAVTQQDPPVRGAQVRFLPGDRKIVTAPGVGTWYGGPLQVIDATTMTLEKTVWPMGFDFVNQQAGATLGGLALGPRP